MIQTSQEWKEYSRDVGIFHINALLDNGTKLHLYDEDFMQGSVNITDSVSGMSDFTVGAVITNTFNGTLNNFSGKFNSYNLASARLAVRFGVTFQESEQPTRVEDGLVSELDGQEYAVDGQIRTPFIPVDSNTEYRINYDYDHDFVLVEFNADKEFISGIEVMGNADYTFTPSSGTAYIRISFGDYGDVFKYDFHIYDGADILWGEVGEWIDRGVYTLEKPTSLGSTIKVVGYDDMDKLNRYYIGKDADNNDITFPIYANGLVMKLCEYCGVTYGSWGLAGGTIDEFEYDESTTCRQVLSWIMQAWGGYARINPQGTLDCKKFNANAWTLGVEMEGGSIQPWYGAGTVSGGSMNPWSAVTDYDGGENGHIDFTLSKIKSLNVYVEDIAVTGVRAYAYNTVDEFQFDTVGTGGYVLAIQDNPLVTDNTLAVATRVYNATKDLKFRPFDASIIGDPSIEAGDIIALQDYLGNAHVSLITSLTYSVNSAERLECNAKTPEEADLETANPQTSVIKGATMAAYDYITAKKISADYITAGTIEAAVIAKNFTMDGGSINVHTQGRDDNVIELEWQTNIFTRDLKITPNNIDITAHSDMTNISWDDEAKYGAGSFSIYRSKSDNTTVELRYQGDGQIFMFKNETANVNLNADGTCYARSWTTYSLEEYKKSINKIDTALEKINTADIVEYNFKDEDTNTKKHIGLAVGKTFNVPQEVITTDENGNEVGVDLYAMVSLAWKAIQEQSEKIEALEKRVAELESLNEKKEK